MNMPMNPLQFMQMMRGGMNPMQIIMGIAQQNPMLGQVMRLVNGRTEQEMEGIARQFARERGLDLDQVARQMGIQLPKRG